MTEKEERPSINASKKATLQILESMQPTWVRPIRKKITIETKIKIEIIWATHITLERLCAITAIKDAILQHSI